LTDSTARRPGYGEDAIYFDAAKNRFVGAISVGFGPGGKRIRRKVTGRTKAEARDKLKAAHNELDRGLHTSATYTVRQAVDDWLEGGLPGRSERTRSIYQEALKPLLEHIGLKPLRELTARDVRRGLEALSRRMSTRYLQLARASLARAIRYAEAHDLVGRNVATLVDNPKGQIGRPSRSFTLEQSLALLEAAKRVPAQCLCRAEPRGRDPHRGGPGTALGSRRPGRQPQRSAARTAISGRLAFGAPGRRHQDRHVAADAGATPGCRPGPVGAP
jgi:hypothetical protein